MQYRIVQADELCHYGILGMRWGIRRFQNSDGTLTSAGRKRYGASIKRSKGRPAKDVANSLLSKMNKIEYSNFTKLKSPSQVERSKKGSCHDQVMYELDYLNKCGIKANASFVIEIDPNNGSGGQTHSFVWFEDKGKTYWLEHAWEKEAGLKEYDSYDSIKKDIRNRWESDDANLYTEMEITDFKPEKHTYGETLQELVDVCLSD